MQIGLKLVVVCALIYSVYCNFSDVTVQSGLSNIEQQPIPMEDCLFNRCVPMGMSGGVAVGDYNNDGWQDLFVTTIFDRDLLFRNNGDGTFSDVTMSSNLGMTSVHRSNGVLWCDFDNDHDLDLFVTTIANEDINPEANRFYLYINNGDGTFSEEAMERGVAQNDNKNKYGTSATCGDYNNDGWIDLHVNQWQGELIEVDTVHTKLYRNRGQGFFEDVSDDHDFADYTQKEYNFASAFIDMDKDGDQDLLISADFKTSQYYRNDNGRFVDITDSSQCCGEDNGMGLTVGDVDNNGYLDWYITSIGTQGSDTQTGNRLYLNSGTNVFTDSTDASNVRYASWGWGASFFDFDNDADQDLICTNGQWTNEDRFKTDETVFWENVNGNGQNMIERHEQYGISDNGVGKSAITLDYDNDGDLDVIISQTGPGIILYENRVNNNNDYLRIKVRGDDTNYYGLGTQISVWVTQNSNMQYQELGGTAHFLGHGEYIAHFGLDSGSNDVFQVEVYFPVSRKTVTHNNIPRNSLITIFEDDDIEIDSSISSASTFTNTNSNSGSRSGSSSSDSNSNSSSNSSSSASILYPMIICICLTFLLF